MGRTYGQAGIVFTQATGVRVLFERIGPLYTPDTVRAIRESAKPSSGRSGTVLARLVPEEADSAAQIEGLMAG